MRAFHFDPWLLTRGCMAGKDDHTELQGHQFAFHIGKEHSPDKVWMHRPHCKGESISIPDTQEEGGLPVNGGGVAWAGRTWGAE